MPRQISEAQLQEFEDALRDIILACDDESKTEAERIDIIRYTAKAALLEA